jgi:dipeptidase E
MRLYLSSFRLGPQHDHLRRLAGTGRRTALIPHALDGAPRRYREEGLGRDVAELEAAGLDARIVDLTMPGAIDGLGAFDILWVRGGNVFVLRRVLADTGQTRRLRSSCNATRWSTAATAPAPAFSAPI